MRNLVRKRKKFKSSKMFRKNVLKALLGGWELNPIWRFCSNKHDSTLVNDETPFPGWKIMKIKKNNF